MTRFRALTFVLSVLTATACTPAYVEAPTTTFRSPIPRMQTFDALYRHALQSGYVMAGLTPHAATFSVQARLAGWRGRRRRSRRGYAPGMGDMFVVEVLEDQVRVRAVGPHIREDGTMHPQLAEELASFLNSLEQASRRAPSRGLASIPAAYGTGGGYGRSVGFGQYGGASPVQTSVTPESVYGSAGGATPSTANPPVSAYETGGDSAPSAPPVVVEQTVAPRAPPSRALASP